MKIREKEVIVALAALAQTHRLRAYRALVVAGKEGITAGVLAEALGVAPAALSFHLKAMSHAGLIASLTEGRFVRYHANYPHMTALLDYLTQHCCAGDPQQCLPSPSPRPLKKKGKKYP